MIVYRHPGFRPAPFRPPVVRMGQVAQEMTPGDMKRAAAGIGLFSSALLGAAAWVGIHTGIEEDGLLSGAGWLVGLTGGLLGAMSLFGTLGILFTSDQALQEAIDRAKRQRGMDMPQDRFITSAPAQMPILQEV